MSEPNTWGCQQCGSSELVDGGDGYFYCSQCNSQAENFRDTGVADEDFHDKEGDAWGGLYSVRHSRRVDTSAVTVKPEPLSQPLDDISPYYYNNFTQTKMEDGHPNADVAVDAEGPTEPEDFGFDSVERYYSEVRMRYVMGVQRMIQLQCECLVREFRVNPLICGFSGTVWLRFLAGTCVFADEWADRTFDDAEIRQEGEPPEDFKPRSKHRAEPHTKFGQRAVMVWFRSLKNTIPLSCTLAISYLACHLSREAVLPTDIVKWSVEGKLPYFSAFLDIEKALGGPSRDCPISSSSMFRPSETVPVQKLESLAASIAESIGLHLPLVNFYAIASRYLNALSLPVEKILPHACRVYEWSMPPELWLSTNEFRLPTRVFVMSILIVAVRILYNIHGFGQWEKSLSSRHASSSTSDQIGDMDHRSGPKTRSRAKEDARSPPHSLDDSGTKVVRNSSNAQNSELDDSGTNVVGNSSNAQNSELDDSGTQVVTNSSNAQNSELDDSVTNLVRNSSTAQNSELDAAELLSSLEARYTEIADIYEYSQDLPTYLKFCKDKVFAGSNPSFKDHKEEELSELLWDFYQNGKDSETADEQGLSCGRTVDHKQLRDNEESTGDLCKEKKYSEAEDTETLKDEAIRRMKLDMEENRFCYIPPRANLKRFDYLHYVRKKDEGAYTYVAHADYYILLRACARVAQVEIRLMHSAVLSIERRLAWLEKRIDHCLHLTPTIVTCEYCTDMVPETTTDAEIDIEESIGLSNVNL